MVALSLISQRLVDRQYQRAEGLRAFKGVAVSGSARVVRPDEVVCRHGMRQRKVLPHSLRLAGMFYEIDQSGRELAGFCFMPEGYLVAGDVMLSQKISLETNETAALKVARRFPVRAVSSASALLFH